MKILAVETSGMEVSIALADGDTLLIERVLDTAGRRNARLLVTAVQVSLRQLSLRPADVNFVAVSIGPGSFTGLRVGVVFAKTFAWINNSKLVAVDTLQGLAQRAVPTNQAVTVISDAQRGDVFVNSYRCVDGLAIPSGEVHIESLTSVVDRQLNNPGCLLTGPAVEKYADFIPDSIACVARDLRYPRAAALMPVAQHLMLNEDWSDAESLEPVYLRRSYAEEKRDSQ